MTPLRAVLCNTHQAPKGISLLHFTTTYTGEGGHFRLTQEYYAPDMTRGKALNRGHNVDITCTQKNSVHEIGMNTN